MRSQFFDGFDFAEYKFSIVAVEHVDEFFNIEKYGLHPVIYDESCLRGYACIFGFTEDKHLALHKLFTNNNGRPAPSIDGIEPVPFHSPAGDLRYDLELAIPYSGSILIANGFIQKYFVPFGFQIPHAFKKVYELTFDQGLFVRVEDRSESARQLRIEYKEPLPPEKKLRLRVAHWFNKPEEYGFDDETLAQYMDLSYDTKYLF